MSQIKILSENDKQYAAEIDGKKVILYKINSDEIKQARVDDLKKAAGVIPDVIFEQLLYFTTSLLSNVPDVNQYERVANEVVVLMDLLYKELKPQNLSHLVHHPIKDINPLIYGKAQTFTHQIEMFNGMLKEINEYKKGN